VELSSVQIATGADGATTVLVRLRDSDPVVLAAGIVEWRRTLVRGRTLAWRAANGDSFQVVVTGFGGEIDEIPLTVVTGPVPADCCLDLELPGEVDDDVLYRWLGDEIANNWPFEPRQLIEAGEPS